MSSIKILIIHGINIYDFLIISHDILNITPGILITKQL